MEASPESPPNANIGRYAKARNLQERSAPTDSTVLPKMDVLARIPAWSTNPIRMKSKDDGSRGPCGPDGSVTPPYITKKSPRNVRHGVLETSLTISRVFSKIEFFDYTRFRPATARIPISDTLATMPASLPPAGRRPEADSPWICPTLTN